ncbi:MAG: biopolymer transporter ExbD [Leptospiraceae bacterium]|nr:MAG: biopolymer transporter ExbD [Leptospiraceae bacterium]
MKNKKNKDIISNINITPFTDVILVLLIIFMISAPSIYLTSIEIQLPKGSNKNSQIQYNEIIGIDKQGNIYYKNKRIDKSEIQNIFKNKTLEDKKKLHILINADKETKHGDVIELINLLNRLDYKNVYVGTSK